MSPSTHQVNELLYQALETEIGGVRIYELAVQRAVNDDLKDEWARYLDQTRNHERILRDILEARNLDPDEDSLGREIVRHLGGSLAKAIEMTSSSAASPEAAQLVAAECVVLAETKDHMNWELIGKIAEQLKGDEARLLREACAQVEDEEDEHLYHTKGWTRELWIASLGMPAVLPPPEEVKKVETAIGAARAEQSRDEMLKSRRSRT